MSIKAQDATTRRRWASTGVALAAAGLLAAGGSVASVAPVLSGTPRPAGITGPVGADIELTSLVQDTLDNLGGLAGQLFDVPLPLLQQLIVNQIHHVADLFDPGVGIGGVARDIWQNFLAAVVSPITVDAAWTWAGNPLNPLNLPHEVAPGLGLLGDNGDPFALTQAFFGGDDALINFTASPLSGLLMGAVGPVLGPLVALYHDLAGLGSSGNMLGDLIGIPGHMVGAYLNGGEVLDSVALFQAYLATTGILDVPILGTAINAILDNSTVGFALGGVLSGPGSLWGSLELESLRVSVFDGTGVGPIAALIAFPQAVATSIGWNAVGNPLAGLGLVGFAAPDSGAPEADPDPGAVPDPGADPDPDPTAVDPGPLAVFDAMPA